MTEGPYYVDEKLDRSDIRSDPTDGAVKTSTSLIIAVTQVVRTLTVTPPANPQEGQLLSWTANVSGAPVG